MNARSNADKITYWLFADRIPLTKLVIVSNAATFLAVELLQAGAIMRYLGFSAASAASMPWTAFTYPLIGLGGGVLGLLFSCYWLWIAGGSLERSWGTRGFGVFFFLVSAVSAAGLLAGALILRVDVDAAGLWFPLAGITVAFALANPEQQILFCFIISMKLKYLAIIGAVGVLLSYGHVNLLLGLFALLGCAFSYWYVRSGMQYGVARPRPRRAEVVRVHDRPGLLRRLNPFRRMRESKDRERLRRLLEGSDGDQDGKSEH